LNCNRTQGCERQRGQRGQRGQQHDGQTAPQPDHVATVAAARLCGKRELPQRGRRWPRQTSPRPARRRRGAAPSSRRPGRDEHVVAQAGHRDKLGHPWTARGEHGPGIGAGPVAQRGNPSRPCRNAIRVPGASQAANVRRHPRCVPTQHSPQPPYHALSATTDTVSSHSPRSWTTCPRIMDELFTFPLTLVGLVRQPRLVWTCMGARNSALGWGEMLP
jgi:hypothetical protein